MKILRLLIAVFTLAVLSNHAYAQESINENDFSAGSEVELENILEQEIYEFGPKAKLLGPDHTKKDGVEDGTKEGEKSAEESTVVEDKYSGLYVEPSLQNISKLYWKKNALELDNDKAIDNFLLINECDIYTKFNRDDFEWGRIREAARQTIAVTKDTFSHKFQIVVPIDLGRYDMERKGFPLINGTAFIDLRRVEIGGNSNSSRVCEKEGLIEHYPRNIILILNKPFVFDFVEIDEHIAQAYIIRQKYDPIKRPKNLLNEHFERLAFARIRITFADYQGVTKGKDNFPLGIMFGKLDGLDIFEDLEGTRMLTSIDF